LKDNKPLTKLSPFFLTFGFKRDVLVPGRVEDNPQGLQNTATGQENSSLHFFVFYAKLCTTCVVFHRLPSEHPSEDRLKTWFAERFTFF